MGNNGETDFNLPVVASNSVALVMASVLQTNYGRGKVGVLFLS